MFKIRQESKMFVKAPMTFICFLLIFVNRFILLQTLAWITKFETTLYPVITTQSSRIADILDGLENIRKRALSELNKALQELDDRIKSIQIFAGKGN